MFVGSFSESIFSLLLANFILTYSTILIDLYTTTLSDFGVFIVSLTISFSINRLSSLSFSSPSFILLFSSQHTTKRSHGTSDLLLPSAVPRFDPLDRITCATNSSFPSILPRFSVVNQQSHPILATLLFSFPSVPFLLFGVS